MRREYRFSGFGGQGVITMCHIVGHAATITGDLDATMTEAYGPEKTGGFSRGDVVVSDTEVTYPAVVEPDVVVAFSQDAFERDADSVTDGGLVMVEDTLVDPSTFAERREDVTIETVPAFDVAVDVGRRLVGNIVMLGTLTTLVDVPPAEVVRDAIRDVVPAGTEGMNETAFDRGRSVLEEEVTA
ncbi:MAG: 2-oxoacid:acceptor oxidoreductase family protein [Halobacteriales archaeon]